MRNRDIEKFRALEKEHHARLRQIVDESIKEERLINQSLAHPDHTPLSLGDKLADEVAGFGGSWKFIIAFTVILILWITLNTIALVQKFDPFPFILMNLFLSFVAAFQAPFIMMSQNRQEAKDRARAENEYLVNLKAELEIRDLHKKIDLMAKEQMKALYEAQAEQLTLLKEINSKLSGGQQEVKSA